MLCSYFLVHKIKVVTDQVLKIIMHRANANAKLIKSVVAPKTFDIKNDDKNSSIC